MSAQGRDDGTEGPGQTEQLESSDQFEQKSGTQGASVTAARLDPQQSACVLIGVGNYEHLPDLPTVDGCLRELERLLSDPSVWGLPKERIWTVRDPKDAGELTDPVYKAIEKASDTLLVYYAGHGLRSIEDEQLYLSLSKSWADRDETSLPYRRLKRILESHRDRVRRRVVVLDCCYSGQAIGGMGATPSAVREAELRTKGSYVLTSTPDDKRAREGAFSGELIKILRNGDGQRPDKELLSLNEIHTLLGQALDRQELPPPHTQDQGGVGALPFVWNKAAQAPAPAPGSYWNGFRVGVAALAVAAAFGLGVAGDRWGPGLWEQKSAPIPGPCGKSGRAELLDVSDRLNEPPYNEVGGNEVAGLSALSFADGTGHAWAVRDDLPAHLFDLSLGSPDDLPGRLTPSISNVQGIYKADGSRFETFDGEGLAVEKGGKTALVSAEEGPAIRRIRLSDGRQVGKDLPLPDRFHPPERGAAQSTRSVESLALTADGKHLYTGMEGPLLGDEDVHGRHQVRIQRYEGSPGKSYEPTDQFAYQTEYGLYLSELVAVDKDHLLALERGYISGLGNGVRVYEVDISNADDVSGVEHLVKEDTDLPARKKLIVDLATCPPGDVHTNDTQQNPLLDNVEGMALHPGKQSASKSGERTLYLISDNNARNRQSTRLYSLSVSLRWD